MDQESESWKETWEGAARKEAVGNLGESNGSEAKGKKIQEGLSSARKRSPKRDTEKCLWNLNTDP